MVVQRLATECRTPGTLDPRRLRAIFLHPESRLDIHGSMEPMDVADGVLDRWCRLPPRALIGLIDAVPSGFAILPMGRYKLWLYKVHLLESSGRLEEALGALEQAHSLRGFPVPLFLASKWLSQHGQPWRARAHLVRA